MTPFESHEPTALEGSLILADPSLEDPNFCRTVLLLTNHDTAKGAHGYVLNRPMEKRVGEILPAEKFAALGDVPVYLGGPVGAEQLTFACFHWVDGGGADGRLRFETHLSAEEARARLAEGFDVRAFVGYSGWSGGQLESELKQHAWIPRPPDERIAAPESLKRLWPDLLRTLGPYYQLVADMPDDVSLN